MKSLNRFYNLKIKEAFIKETKLGYREQYKYLFSKTYFMEYTLNKDLYNFTLEELAKLMERFKCTTRQALRLQYQLIYHYLSYYQELRDDKIHPLYLENGNNWCTQFVDTKTKTLLSNEEFKEVIGKCRNAQDAVIFQLIFEGINGHKHSEILNLKEQDVDWKSQILIVNDDQKGQREVEVSSNCLELIKKAIKEKEYYLQNGNSPAKCPTQLLVENDYVVRCLTRKAKHTENAERNIVYRRVKGVFKDFYPNVKPKSIEKSGMIKFAVDLSIIYKLPIKDFNYDYLSIICKKFNKKQSISMYTSIRREVLEHVENLYGDLLELIQNDFELVSKGEVETVKSSRKKRVAAFSFRQDILLTYEKCAITGETFPNVLEACHIEPYINENSNHIQNGILLRCDFHKLFDDGFLIITDDYRIKVSSLIKSKYYQSFNEKKLNLPDNTSFYPSLKALYIHRKCNLNNFKD